MKNKRAKILFDGMGVLFAVLLIVLAITGLDRTQDVLAPSAGHVIVIDAGHGGVDGGAQSADKSVKEAGLNLEVARLVEKGLKEEGFTVIMTRTNDDALASDKKSDMKKRREIMRGEDVDCVVSIHMNNWRDVSVSGPFAFYMNGSQEGEKLAQSIISSLCDTIQSSKRQANPGDYYVLRESICPAVIVECGFMSNPEDLRLLQSKEHQKKLAEGIVAGVKDYFNEVV